MFFMIEKGITNEICDTVLRHTKSNHKYTKVLKQPKILHVWNIQKKKLPCDEFQWDKTYKNAEEFV